MRREEAVTRVASVVPLPQRGLVVMIAGATGLAKKGRLDAYCSCHVEGRDDPIIVTEVANGPDPLWNSIEQMDDFDGRSLTFNVMHQAPGKKDPLLAYARLSSTRFHPFGFIGRLPLAGCAGRTFGTEQAILFVAVLPTPLWRGAARMPKDGGFDQRYFVVEADALVYYADLEAFRAGDKPRGSISFRDVEDVGVDEAAAVLTIRMYASAYDVRIDPMEDVQRWRAALKRGLWLQTLLDRADDVLKIPLCEGELDVSQGDEDEELPRFIPRYFVLSGMALTSLAIGVPMGRNSVGELPTPMDTHALADVQLVDADSRGVITIQLKATALKLRAAGWLDMQRWGSAIRNALSASGSGDRVDWSTFLTCPVCEGLLEIQKDSGRTPRWFVLRSSHLEYFESEAACRGGAKDIGMVELGIISKVILWNESTLTVTVDNGRSFQVCETEPGAGRRWASAFEAALDVHCSKRPDGVASTSLSDLFVA